MTCAGAQENSWAGTAANRTLAASLGDLVDPVQRIGDQMLRMRNGSDPRKVAAQLTAAPEAMRAPKVNDHAVHGLKFSAALPIELARQTVASRLVDEDGAAAALRDRRSLRYD